MSMRKGWECPVCGVVNSPDVKRCCSIIRIKNNEVENAMREIRNLPIKYNVRMMKYPNKDGLVAENLGIDKQ